jgi:hypothetical protein
MKAKREKIAKAIGLIDRGWKYNVACDEPDLEERFYCRKDNWKPDEDWNQLARAYAILNSANVEQELKEEFELVLEQSENK